MKRARRRPAALGRAAPGVARGRLRRRGGVVRGAGGGRGAADRPAGAIRLGSSLDELFAGVERVSILVTIGYHARELGGAGSALRRADLRAGGGGASGCRDICSLHALSPAGDELPGGARSFAIGKPRRGEQPLWLPSHRALVFGDSVVEYGGKLRVWAQDKVDEKVRRFYRERFNPTLAPLLELDVERVLVTHGEPVLSGGGEALRAGARLRALVSPRLTCAGSSTA